MNILITGASGFVGTHLTRFFIQNGDSVVGVDAEPTTEFAERHNYRFIGADTTRPGAWQEAILDADIIINLAGRNIFNYWTERYKEAIHDSRILTTRRVVEAINRDRETVLCNASAVGYYGNGGDTVLREDSDSGDDFLAEVCREWEAEAAAAEARGARVVMTRFGLVMGSGGGALSKMIPAFKFYVGGPLGSGKHWMPWIHIDDLARAMAFVVQDKEIQGPINFCAPEPVQNAQFSRTLGKVLHRPAFLRIPEFAVKTLLSELGETMLSSQRAVPDRLIRSGFTFDYPDIQTALEQILNET